MASQKVYFPLLPRVQHESQLLQMYDCLDRYLMLNLPFRRTVLHAMRSHNHDSLAQEYGCTALRQLAAAADASVNDPSVAEASGVQPTNCWSSNRGTDQECTYAIGSKEIIAHVQLDRSFDQAE